MPDRPPSTHTAGAAMSCRHLVLVLGDQLDRASAALDEFSVQEDRVLMIESREESQRIWSHKARTVLFLAAMRHHAAWLGKRGYRVDYVGLRDPEAESFEAALRHYIEGQKPQRLVMVEAGEFGVQQTIESVCVATGVELEVREDRHFMCSKAEFQQWRSGRKTMVMEHFYRWMRKQHDVLIDEGQPVGGKWNYDKHNRKAFGRNGPGIIPGSIGFKPDAITRAVMKDVEHCFPDNPGALSAFNWPVTREQVLTALGEFVSQRLVAFGAYQDAMWDSEPTLYHSLLAAALNLKLLSPREVIDAALSAYHAGRAPLASVEGFVRQIIGWREFVRGIYWSEMPGYTTRNELDAQRPLPEFYWTGQTDMACLAAVIGQTLEIGYAHHIQRLMVTGLFAMLLGVRPDEVHRWYLAVYVDAVEWVEAPNTLGMSQHADGGLLGSKPYAASGRYIQRMSNYCSHCRYKPDQSTGELACPFTTLYWDFLMRHEKRFTDHPRAGMQWRMLAKLDAEKRAAITEHSAAIAARLCDGDAAK